MENLWRLVVEVALLAGDVFIAQVLVMHLLEEGCRGPFSRLSSWRLARQGRAAAGVFHPVAKRDEVHARPFMAVSAEEGFVGRRNLVENAHVTLGIHEGVTGRQRPVDRLNTFLDGLVNVSKLEEVAHMNRDQELVFWFNRLDGQVVFERVDLCAGVSDGALGRAISTRPLAPGIAGVAKS